MTTLRVHEIFYSLQGESNMVGFPTLFIRLSGCSMRCVYCDSTLASQGGETISLDEILSRIQPYQTKRVLVTGGEPLQQKNCLPLLTALCDRGYQVGLETSGICDIKEVDSRVVKIMDIKTPGSEQAHLNLYSNLNFIHEKDQIKFVICHYEDYCWTKEIIETYQLLNTCEVLISPRHRTQSVEELAHWILEDQLNVRLQIQLHKYIWGDDTMR